MKSLLALSLIIASMVSTAHADDSFTIQMNNKTYTCSEGGSSSLSCRILAGGEKIGTQTCPDYYSYCAVLIKYGAPIRSMFYITADSAASACDEWLKNP